MSSFAQSKPVFLDRAASAGLAPDVVELVTKAGLDTLSSFAFSSSYVPGSGEEKPFVAVVKDILKRDPTLAELASFRKLLYESYSLVTAEMKQQLERSEDVQVRKLTQPERADLYEKQKKRITGLTLKGPLEPSDNLIDLYSAMYESNRVRFIPWEKYTCRESELDKELKTEQMFSVDSNGQLKLENKKQDPVADTSSEIMLQYALQRRGLSMDQVNLLEFTIHQQWIDRLIKARLQVPPPGYQKPSFRQLLEADKKLFEELADSTRSGVQAKQGGRPLDKIFVTCMNKPEVVHLLQPLMGNKPNDLKSDDKKPSASASRPAPYPASSSGKGKGKNKSKGKSAARLPATLLEGGCRAVTNRGDPICFGYNLGTCNMAVSNGRCDRGFHVCALPKCGKHHPFLQCPMKKSDS